MKNNSGTPDISFFLYHRDMPVREGDENWKRPIPLNRKHLSASDFSVSCGDYFQAVEDFLRADHFRAMVPAFSERLGSIFSPDEISAVRICLEKHGEFYHPARIEAESRAIVIPFAMNVAVSEAGKACIAGEYDLLKRFPFPFVPKVWKLGSGACASGMNFPMFLGEWFEGFHEFHISSAPGETQQTAVWAPEGHFFLTQEQTCDLYREIARIMTLCYNIETFEHIFPWHHAAGDFVAKIGNSHTDVKLITVRQYVPIVNIPPGEADEADLVYALLLFFIKLSFHIRVDRREGTGDLIWSDDLALEPAVQGFFKGLRQKEPPFSDALVRFFLHYVLSLPEKEIRETAFDIAGGYPAQSQEIHLIRTNLEKHVKILHQILHDGKLM
ncbi:MAG: hypothetical protein AB7S75_04110 [Desulfococcaceae bacterium]